MSTNTEELSLELEFIEQFVDEDLGKCPCPNPNCRTLSFKKKGTNVDYIIDFDPEAKELETNVVVRAEISPEERKMVNPLVFNGKCRSNMDFAKVLNMVIL